MVRSGISFLILLFLCSNVLAQGVYKMRHNPQTGRGDWVNTDEGIYAASGWTNAPGVTFLTDSTDNVGIGSATPQQKLDVDGIIYAQGFELNRAIVGTPSIGRFTWDSQDLAPNIQLDPNVTLQVGQETLIRGVNKTGITIYNGNAVALTGAVGQRPKIVLAQGNSETTGHLVGVATETIAINQEGFVTVRGLVRGIQTDGDNFGETWSDGDVLWVSTTEAGGMTNVEPTAPHHSDVVGLVVNANPSNGSILVQTRGHKSLTELSDVNGTPLVVDGQMPSWRNTRGVFDFDGAIYNTSTNVGVGSTSPAQKLDVAGNVRAGNYYSDLGQFTLGGIGLTNNEGITYDVETFADIILSYSLTGATYFWQDFPQKINITSSFPTAKQVGLVLTNAKSNTGFIENAPANFVDGVQFQVDDASPTDFVELFHMNLPANAKRATAIAVGVHGDGQRGILVETSGSNATTTTPYAIKVNDKANTGTANPFTAQVSNSDVMRIEHDGSIYSAGNVSINTTELGTTQTSKLFLRNTSVGSIQVPPSMSFFGNAYTSSTNFPIEWRIGGGNSTGAGIGSDFSIRSLIPAIASDLTLMTMNFDGSKTFNGTNYFSGATQIDAVTLVDELRIDATIDHSIYNVSDDFRFTNPNSGKKFIFQTQKAGVVSDFVQIDGNNNQFLVTNNTGTNISTGIMSVTGSWNTGIAAAAMSFTPTITAGSFYGFLVNPVLNSTGSFTSLAFLPTFGNNNRTASLINFAPSDHVIGYSNTYTRYSESLTRQFLSFGTTDPTTITYNPIAMGGKFILGDDSVNASPTITETMIALTGGSQRLVGTSGSITQKGITFTGFGTIASTTTVRAMEANGGLFSHKYSYNGTSNALLFGASEQVGMGFNGTNFIIDSRLTGTGNIVLASGNVGINSTAPTSKLAVDGTVYMGTTGVGATTIEADGTIYMLGAATAWEDLQVDLNSSTAVYAPTITTKYGSRLYTFSDEAVNEDELPFIAQMPHAWKTGSTISPHFHFVGEDGTACNFAFGIRYRWTNINAAIAGSDSSVSVVAANSTTTDLHNLVETPDIAGTGKTLSSIIDGTIYRNSTNPLDTCNGKSFYLLQFDIHIEKDTMGSRQEYSK